jgi:NitT/TauT family transport system substrate-binding protein
MQLVQSRRDFLTSLSVAGGVGILGARTPFANEPPPEVTTVRLGKIPGICIAPQYLEDLLRVEGFTEVIYIPTQAGSEEAIKTARGEIDVSMNFVGPSLISMDAGERLTMLAGVHPGCFELFGNSRIRTIADLKGKSVGVLALGSGQHVFLASMATYVGLDPLKDINWVTSTSPKPVELYAAGKIDAFLGFPPEPQELRARHIGNVIVNSATDRPWSQYFCCLLTANQGFVVSIRSRPSACCAPCSKELTSASRPGTGCAAAGRQRIHHGHRLCPPDARRSSLWRVAGLRPRGHDAVLRAAPARGGVDQVHAQQAHYGERRLALLERAEARA